LAPKLSVLQESFARSDLGVVAIYIETCGGVPDHAVGLREHVKTHGLTYPTLNGETGKLVDPTRERMRWAPHALVIDNTGRVLRTYPHVPDMKQLKADLDELVATGHVPPRPDDGWRDFKYGAWVEVKGDGPGIERRSRIKGMPSGILIRRGDREEKILHARPVRVVRKRRELEPANFVVDGRRLTARVVEREYDGATERTWIAHGTLLRGEIVEPGVRRTIRLLRWAEPVTIGDKTVSCRVVETVTVWREGRRVETVWLSDKVPGHEVKRVRKTVQGGKTSTETSTVVAFGLRK